jgi:beta-lactamase regulating signal transducer with metallopeptidase domain
MFLLAFIIFSACMSEEFFDHDNLSTKNERLILNTLLLILNVIFILSLWKLADAIDAKKIKLLVILSIVIPYLNFLVACYLVFVVFNGTRNKRFPN